MNFSPAFFAPPPCNRSAFWIRATSSILINYVKSQEVTDVNKAGEVTGANASTNIRKELRQRKHAICTSGRFHSSPCVVSINSSSINNAFPSNKGVDYISKSPREQRTHNTQTFQVSLQEPLVFCLPSPDDRGNWHLEAWIPVRRH